MTDWRQRFPPERIRAARRDMFDQAARTRKPTFVVLAVENGWIGSPVPGLLPDLGDQIPEGWVPVLDASNDPVIFVLVGDTVELDAQLRRNEKIAVSLRDGLTIMEGNLVVQMFEIKKGEGK